MRKLWQLENLVFSKKKSKGQVRLGSDTISGPFPSHAKHLYIEKQNIRSKMPKTKSPNYEVIEEVKP